MTWGMLPYIAVSRGGNWGGWSRELDLGRQCDHDDDDVGDDQYIWWLWWWGWWWLSWWLWGGWSRELDLDCQYHDDDDVGDDDDDYDQYDDFDYESSLCFLGPGHRVSAESVWGLWSFSSEFRTMEKKTRKQNAEALAAVSFQIGSSSRWVTLLLCATFAQLFSFVAFALLFSTVQCCARPWIWEKKVSKGWKGSEVILQQLPLPNSDLFCKLLKLDTLLNSSVRARWRRWWRWRWWRRWWW